MNTPTPKFRRRLGAAVLLVLLALPATAEPLRMVSEAALADATTAVLDAAATAATNYTDAAIGAAIANTNPTFSNAVLAVGLNLDTNTVAAINALVEAGDELPIGGAAAVGALLIALAAAVAALKRTKADASAIAPTFSTSSTYAMGEYVTYNGMLYRCTTAVTTAGAWDASKWTADNMAAILGNIEAALDTINNGAQS